VARRLKSRDEAPQPLYETLSKLKSPVSAEHLFDAAGYSRDSVADVEAFYLALREELGSRIRERARGSARLLEVQVDASR